MSTSPGLPRDAPPRTQPPPAGDETPATPHPGTGRRCSPPPAPVTSTTRPSNLRPAAMALRCPAPDCATRRPGRRWHGKAGQGRGREGTAGEGGRSGVSADTAHAPAPPSGKRSLDCNVGPSGAELRGGESAAPGWAEAVFLGSSPCLLTVFPCLYRQGQLLVKYRDFNRRAHLSCSTAGTSSQVS